MEINPLAGKPAQPIMLVNVPRLVTASAQDPGFIDLMALQPPGEPPHGISEKDFERLFTRDKPIIFAFHGYSWLIHRLTSRRSSHDRLHVRGYTENGTITPFDMAGLNDLGRFHLAGDVIDRVPGLGSRAAYAKPFLRDKLLDHKACIEKHGENMPEIRNWKWEG